MISETVYIGRDNAIDVQLQDDRTTPGTWENADLTDATKVEVVLDLTTVYGSDTHPSIVMFTTGGIVTLKLGLILTEVATHSGEIIVYDSINTDGVAWQPKLKLKAVLSEPV